MMNKWMDNGHKVAWKNNVAFAYPYHEGNTYDLQCQWNSTPKPLMCIMSESLH